jgi:hypothetical protein
MSLRAHSTPLRACPEHRRTGQASRGNLLLSQWDENGRTTPISIDRCLFGVWGRHTQFGAEISKTSPEFPKAGHMPDPLFAHSVLRVQSKAGCHYSIEDCVTVVQFEQGYVVEVPLESDIAVFVL